MVNGLLENTEGQNILCCGYGFPYLEPLTDKTRSRLAFMPAAMGVRRWPASVPNCAALVDLCLLPLPDSSFDAVLVIHGLEFSRDPEEFLSEIWRVLVPSGRAIIVVPNRRGLWSHSDHTPFGYGQPFTRRQLARTMSSNGFRLRNNVSALYSPPFEGHHTQRLCGPAEKIGRTLWRNLAGVLVQEAEKQILSGEPIAKPAMPLAAVRPAPTA
jgi:SAM-dependent methyltransferase